LQISKKKHPNVPNTLIQIRFGISVFVIWLRFVSDFGYFI